MSSLDLGNRSSDADELTVSSSDPSNSNNRSILGQQPSYVIPVDYSFGHSPLPNHHLQVGVGSNSQSSHG